MNLKKIIKKLEKDKKTFTVTYFNSHVKINIGKHVIKDRLLGGFDFNLSNKVKKEAYIFYKQNYEVLQEFKEKEIMYIKEPSIRPLYKSDIVKAYWFAARQFFLSESLFLEGLKVGKTARLQALGSLATKRIEVFYINGFKVKESATTNELEPVYNLIAWSVDKFMRLYAFEGYWVDCGFFSCKDSLYNFEFACGMAGFQYKNELVRSYKKIDNIHIINNKVYTFKKKPTLKDLVDC